VTFDLPLRGAGGEPVDFYRTIHSHGLITLSPNEIPESGDALRMPLRLSDGRATVVEIRPGDRGFARVIASGPLRGTAIRAELTFRVRRILHLDGDYSAFYRQAAADPELRWVTRGAGRFVHSATVFEDVIKTICTTNTAWSATIRMTDALVAGWGEAVAGAAGTRLFPTPQALAKAPERWYREVARTGYRGPYLRAVAASVARGEVDLEALADTPPEQLSDAELERRLLELPGVGPYAAAHIMMLMGRYSRLVLDSSTRPKYARLSRHKPRSDATIERRFKRYGRFAGLAFWCYVTSDWLDDSAVAMAERTPASDSVS
jgi:3-methyladenine DNA glycosylase/8-oxoguanine DNA glycosylase